jgi:hypothetical protein
MKFGRAAASRHHHPGVQRRHQHPADAAIDHAAVNTPLRVLICYDREDDDTLPAIRNHRAVLGALTIASCALAAAAPMAPCFRGLPRRAAGGRRL